MTDIEKMYNCDGLPVLVTLPDWHHSFDPYPYYTVENRVDRECGRLGKMIAMVLRPFGVDSETFVFRGVCIGDEEE